MPKYVDVEKIDVEQINCFYGNECRLSDVQEFLDELVAEPNVEKIVRCKDCLFGQSNTNKLYNCSCGYGYHVATYFCADAKPK